MNEKQKALMAAPLQGLKVLEISQYVAGPSAAAILADFGADVIKVEHPIRGDGWRGFVKTTLHPRREINFPFEQDNRNKRAMTLDISKKEGQKVAHQLISQCDVLINNLRPNELKRYDLEYETLNKLNPKLIWANITGYGLTGPDCEQAGYDFSAFWARAGFQAIIKEPGRPPVFARNGMGDHITGLALVGGIMMALYTRDRTGLGQAVDISLLGTGMWTLSYDIMSALTQDSYIQPMTVPERAALASIYQAKDEKWIMLWMPTPDPYWSAFCKALGLEHIEKDERFSSFAPRRANNAQLRPIVVEAVAKKTRHEWEAIFKEHDLIFSPIQDPIDLTKDKQAWATGRFISFEHPVYGPFHWVNNPIGLSEAPTTIKRPSPEFGQHTEEVLLEMGFSWDDITGLKDTGIIA